MKCVLKPMVMSVKEINEEGLNCLAMYSPKGDLIFTAMKETFNEYFEEIPERVEVDNIETIPTTC